MNAAREANIVLSNAMDDHLNAATDLAHALLMIACSEIFGGDEAERRTVNTLAATIIDHQKALHDAWCAWVAGGAIRADGEGEPA